MRWVLCVGFWAVTLTGMAQGTRSDYERSNSLAQRTENKIYRNSIQPHWIPDKPVFWYQISTGPQTHEFIMVDAKEEDRDFLFDHGRLAEALTAALGLPVPAAALPLQQLEYNPEANEVRFRCHGRGWKYEIEANRLSETPLPEKSIPPLAKPESELASRHTGEETTLTFVNRHDAAAELFWLDSEGRRKSYGTVPPGGDRRISTYSGHIWVVIGPGDARWGIFEAKVEGGIAVLDQTFPPTAPPQEAPSPELPGHRSPDEKWSLVVVSNNIHLHRAGSIESTALTTDGTPEDAYTDELEWSPNSQFAAVLRVRPAQEHRVFWVESSPTDRLEPKLHSQDYLKPGDQVACPRPYLVQVQAAKVIPVATNLCANPYQLEGLRWSPDSRRFTFEYNQRGHQVYRVLSVDSNTGELSTLIEETSPTFIDYSGKHFLHWSDARGVALWMSERDGWNHLWRYDLATGRALNQVTRGNWVVREVLEVNDQTEEVWFLAGGVHPEQDPYYQHLCRVKFDGTGFVVLTEGDGTHHIEFSPDHTFFIDRWSRVDQPPITELRRSADGSMVLELERADIHELADAGWEMPERFTAKGRDGKTDIHGVIIRPSQFSKEKKYPVIEEVYAGPQDAYVPKAFGREVRKHALAELGFIVVQVDGMGTSGRSKAFHDVCWKNLADAGFPDRIAWIRAAAVERPWMDLTRVGIYGGSAGGQNALRALIDHADFYHVAVADCGCHDNRMDKIWWNEQWMGWPIGPEYEASSNVAQAHRMRGKLLLIYGEMDTNVDPSSTLQVVNALEKADRDFELLVMTGTGHGAAETPYGNRRRFDFLVRHLWDREPRWQ